MELIRIEIGVDTMPDGSPLKNVVEYSTADVLCGRGGGTNHHTGNNHWRALVAANKRLYISLPKKQKVLVAKSIVHAIRSQTPRGRFLQKENDSNKWNDIGDQKATEKTSQALREGAPDIRTEMEHEQKQTEPVGLKTLDQYPKPGQLLPNGLIALDYEGVLSAQQRGGRGPLEDGTIDINHPVLANNNNIPVPGHPQQQQQQVALQPVDPMMQAFQQFQAGMMGLQQGLPPGMMAPGMAQKNPFQAQSIPSADPVSAFQQFLSSSSGQQGATAPPPLPAVATQPETKASIQRLIKESDLASPPSVYRPKLPLSRRTSGGGSLASAASMNVPVPGTQSLPTESVPVNANPPSSLGQENFLYSRLLCPNVNRPTPPLPRRTSDGGSFTPAASMKVPVPGTQSLPTESVPVNANLPSILGQENFLYSRLLCDIPQAPATNRDFPLSKRTSDSGSFTSAASMKVPVPGTQSLPTESVPVNANPPCSLGQENFLYNRLLGPNVNRPTLPPSRRTSDSGSFAPAASMKVPVSGTQSLPTESVPVNANPTSNLGQENFLYSRLLGDIPQAPATSRDSLQTGSAPAPSMTREMALQILLEEKAQQAREEAAEAQLKTFQSLQSMAANSHLPSNGVQGLTGSSQRSSSLFADYMAQMGTAPAPPLPTLGNVSSMSDEAIREMLHTLQQQTQPSSAPDPYSLAGLTRNTSLMGNRTSADILGSAGGRLSDALGTNSGLHHPRPQSDTDKYANQYANVTSAQPSSSLASTIARPEFLGRSESIGLQQAILDAMQYLGPYDTPNLEAAESLGPTPLRPGVSATLAQMKMADLFKHSVYDATTAGGTGQPAVAAVGAMTGSIGDGSRRVFCVPPAAAIYTATTNTTSVPTFKTGAALNQHVKMTSTPQRGFSGGSLDDLCRAAGLYLSPIDKALAPGKTDDDLLGVLLGGGGSDHGGITKKFERKPAPSDASGLSKKMKMFQGLMDAQQQPMSQMRKPASAPCNGWATAEWENVRKSSNNSTSGLKLGKNDQSLVDDSDDEGDNIAAKQPVIASQSKRRVRHSFADHEQQRPAKRHTRTANSNGKSSKEVATAKPLAEKRNILDGLPSMSRGVSLNRGVSFLRDIRTLPITETALDRGHSLAMSEISLDRGQSIPAAIGLEGIGDEGQFDDASEDGEQDTPSIGDKAAIQRGLTFGTIHTFSSALGR